MASSKRNTQGDSYDDITGKGSKNCGITCLDL